MRIMVIFQSLARIDVWTGIRHACRGHDRWSGRLIYGSGMHCVVKGLGSLVSVKRPVSSLILQT